MDDKKQESKKTVVSFAAGLIVGGLLVWLFSGSPEAAAPDSVSDIGNPDAELDGIVRDNGSQPDEEATAAGESADDRTQSDFTFTITNQPAGTSVSLGELKYPTGEGWVVVHEDVGGELGSALGAVRYDTKVGLTPDHIQLLRATQTGKTYRVVYYSEDGNHMFDLKEDTPLTASDGRLIEATFVAQ